MEGGGFLSRHPTLQALRSHFRNRILEAPPTPGANPLKVSLKGPAAARQAGGTGIESAPSTPSLPHLSPETSCTDPHSLTAPDTKHTVY